MQLEIGPIAIKTTLTLPYNAGLIVKNITMFHSSILQSKKRALERISFISSVFTQNFYFKPDNFEVKVLGETCPICLPNIIYVL